MRLLLCCARLRLDQATQDEIDDIASMPLNWDRILALAGPHGLKPLLHKHLGENQSVKIPTAVRDILARDFRETALLNLRMLGELFELIDLLAASDIVAIPYKGPVLAEFLYGDVALRRCYDLDILVAPENVPATVELMRGRGYRQSTAVKPDLRFNHHLAMAREDGLVVEIHWTLLPPHLALKLDYEQIVHHHLVPITVKGRSVNSLADDLLVVALSAHGAKHRWNRLMWICDVALLVERMSSAGPALHLAKRTGSQRALICGFDLVHRVLRYPLPKDAAAAVSGASAERRMAEWVISNLTNAVAGPPSHMFLLKSRDRSSDRLRYLYVLARRPSMESQLIKLPRRLKSLYIVLKALRFLGVSPLRHRWPS